MRRLLAGLAAVVLALGGTAAWAVTVLEHVTPQNIKGSTFALSSKPGPNNTVEFVIRRNVRGIDWPARKGYVSDSATEGRSLGAPVRLEEDRRTFTFRFAVPAEKVKDSTFSLYGVAGESPTFKFRLGDFWNPDKG